MSDSVTNTGLLDKVQRPPMYGVVFLNDDFTPMLFVERVLTTIFHKPLEEAQHIVLMIHTEGKAKVGCYTYEVAMHKVDQTLMLARLNQHPLQVFADPI